MGTDANRRVSDAIFTFIKKMLEFDFDEEKIENVQNLIEKMM